MAPAAARRPPPAIQVLHVRDRAVLRPFVHAAVQRQALALDSGDILIVYSAVRA
ncbi:hypothetical protein SBRCBS47491_010242 [Sporothrix bragantina]|uniref:Uncharacterized protein n=1 Tax=Sporothrix bragantina TaxID=671064 RepID=A0ABP0D0S3_9PEZI